MAKYSWIAIFVVLLIWSGVAPRDRVTWVLEVAPAVIGFAVLALTYRSFRLTSLVYWLILAQCAILMVGGHYTYAEVPWFDHLFGSARNNYDKLGHFAQGFVPAMIAREVVIRRSVIPSAGWQFFFIVSFCLGLSAFYELLEWWVALASEEAAEAFLGTQGYVWDTQSDMGYALLGALGALLLLGRWHDRQLGSLEGAKKRSGEGKCGHG